MQPRHIVIPLLNRLSESVYRPLALTQNPITGYLKHHLYHAHVPVWVSKLGTKEKLGFVIQYCSRRQYVRLNIRRE